MPAGNQAWPGTATVALARRRSTGVTGSSVRRSRGRCGATGRPGRDIVEPRGDVGVGVEAEHGIGLGQRLRQLLAVALGQAADRHDPLAGVRRSEQGVDRVLLRRVDEPAGVHHHDVRGVRVGGERPARRIEPAGQLLGVHLVAGAAQCDQGNTAGGVGHDSRLPATPRSATVTADH